MTKDLMTDLRVDDRSIAECAKNNAIRYASSEDGIALVVTESMTDGQAIINCHLPAGLIQFAMSGEGDCKLQFGPHYAQDLAASESMLLYNPNMDLDYQFSFHPGDRTAFIFCTVERLHHLLTSDHEQIHFLSESNIGNKYYDKSQMNAQLRMSMDVLYTTQLSSLSQRLFYTGKALELLSFYFDTDGQADYTEKCPFLKDQRNVDAVRRSKELLLADLSSPPTIKDLSIEVGLNESQLKQGFKNIYGNTMHAYLIDHRLNHALKLMVTDGFKVQEAAGAIGYSNPSHFIAAFKKKYGVTPKQYMIGRN